MGTTLIVTLIVIAINVLVIGFVWIMHSGELADYRAVLEALPTFLSGELARGGLLSYPSFRGSYKDCPLTITPYSTSRYNTGPDMVGICLESPALRAALRVVRKDSLRSGVALGLWPFGTFTAGDPDIDKLVRLSSSDEELARAWLSAPEVKEQLRRLFSLPDDGFLLLELKPGSPGRARLVMPRHSMPGGISRERLLPALQALYALIHAGS
jgi:hypothetical protein